MKKLFAVFCLTIFASSSFAAMPVQTASERTRASNWFASAFLGDAPAAFSFYYGGSPFNPEGWRTTHNSKKIDADRTKHFFTYTAPDGRLKAECDAVVYKNYPAVEWVLRFRNVGSVNTGQISNVKALDGTFAASGTATIYHGGGANNAENDFGLMTDSVAPGGSFTIGSRGMSSLSALPFFTADSNGTGVVGAVGWSCNWDANFAKDADTLTIDAGMPGTNLFLAPGESVRSPRMLILLYEGDYLRGQNMWRRLMMKYYSPTDINGDMLRVPVTDANWGSFNAASQKSKIDWWTETGMNLEVYWIDAGWSGDSAHIDDWSYNAADRNYNPDIYPNGIKEISDYAHDHGMKFLLWTWPHIARVGCEIGKEHPEWIIGGNFLDHGNPATNAWMKKYFSAMIKNYGIDWYRQDGHPVIPGDYNNKTGYNEIKYFEGMYDYWDYLLKDNPGLGIDNCAGGGRKIDLETSMRSISLWRSDYQVPNSFDPIGMQGQTYGLSNWVPLSSGCSAREDCYGMRSGYSPGLCINWHVFQRNHRAEKPNFNYDTAARYLQEYYDIRDCFYGDYYPISDYNVDHSAWMAYQFDLPEKGDGILQAFRREQSNTDHKTYKFKGLDPGVTYTVTNLDDNSAVRRTGASLMSSGLRVNISSKPGAAVLRYKADIASEFVSDTIPDKVVVGETRAVSVTFRNVGAQPWTAAEMYRLGAVDDTDPFAGNRQELPSDVPVGATVTFTFNMTFPAAGVYTTDWRMVRDGVAWFGGTASKTVTVMPTGDKVPPTAPANLRQTEFGETNAKAEWDPSEDNYGVAKYKVYLDSRVAGYTEDTEFSFEGLDPAKQHTVGVIALDDYGNTSGRSDTLYVTCLTPFYESGFDSIEGWAGAAASLSDEYNHGELEGGECMKISKDARSALVYRNFRGDSMANGGLKDGSYTVWFYDTMDKTARGGLWLLMYNSSGIVKYGYFLGVDESDTYVGGVVRTNVTLTGYFSYRSEGWHKLEIRVGAEGASFYVDDEYGDTADPSPDSSYAIRRTALGYSGSCNGDLYFDDAVFAARPPASPNNLKAAEVTDTSVLWTMRDNSDNGTGFVVLDDGVVTATGYGEPSVPETGLPPNTAVSRRAKATAGPLMSINAASSATAVTLSAPPTTENVAADVKASAADFTAVGGFGQGTVEYYLVSCGGVESRWGGGAFTCPLTNEPKYVTFRGFNSANVENGSLTLGPYVAALELSPTEARSAADGTLVYLPNVTVTAVFADCVYVTDGVSGIKVAGAAGEVGDVISVRGTLATEDGERVIR
ncbi:MAG: alpha-galactosidase [Abditibacteriota bacterium]|nr:alpha-galactosidase [Abditibacteriota bacterium]